MYAHGGFMGAAASMMNDAKWREIFRTLMPKDYDRALKIKLPDALMAFMENNPVLSAYGSLRQQREIGGRDERAAPDADHKALTLEWDVWLPAKPTKDMDILSNTRIAHGSALTTMIEKKGNPLTRTPPGTGRDAPEVGTAPSATKWVVLFGQAIAMARGASPGAAKGKPGFGNEPRGRVRRTGRGHSRRRGPTRTASGASASVSP